jgi:hypothetical protein
MKFSLHDTRTKQKQIGAAALSPCRSIAMQCPILLAHKKQRRITTAAASQQTPTSHYIGKTINNKETIQIRSPTHPASSK